MMNGDINSTVAVVDYGMGNLRSVAQALMHATRDTHIQVLITHSRQQVQQASRVVLPGQGAMADCMHQLEQSDLLEPVLQAARTKPLFGVCVGMQMLLEHSAEGRSASSGGTAALGLIAGQVRRFTCARQKAPDGSLYKVPQMGWNTVEQTRPHPLWRGIANNSWFYFVHSYFADPQNDSDVAGLTDFGGPFASALARENIFATQFHPEKSADMGLALYRNFLYWNP